MRLVDLEPTFLGAGGEGVTRNGQPMPERHRVGLTPSILRLPAKGGCGWHGFIRNGEVVAA